MALVKTTKIGSAKPTARIEVATPNRNNRKPAALTRAETVSERLAAASEEISRGLAEASAAATELTKAMEQISSGAEEAAGASQEQAAALKRIFESLRQARAEAETSRRRTEAVQALLSSTSMQIVASARAMARYAERQDASVAVISELERRAQDIGNITLTVSQISDQTNLLALNAAIEAARAGDSGRGFAVVADEVRALAESSDRSACDVKTLTEEIQADVRSVVADIKKASQTAAGEASDAGRVVEALDARRSDMERIVKSSMDILAAATDAESAASQAQRGAELVASAAEEQSSGADEARTATAEQAKSIDQGRVASRDLAAITEKLRGSRATAAGANQIATTAEELSATIQEMTSAANQIMAAVEQIGRGTQQQASATHQASSALNQIEGNARQSLKTTEDASERVSKIEAALNEIRKAVEKLMTGVGDALSVTQTSIVTISRLEAAGRQIEKIVDAIALVTVQTTMLAVSGSVEAARAGDAGRGFAVVSGDIRALARESASNVERAKDTVRGILEQIVALRRDLEQTILTAETEVQTNRTIYAALGTVDADLAALSAGNNAVRDGARVILSSVAEAASGARQIASAAEEASAAARQAAAAATEQAKGAEDLAASIEEIALLAEALRQDV